MIGLYRMVPAQSVWLCVDHCLLEAGSCLMVQEDFSGLEWRIFADREITCYRADGGCDCKWERAGGIKCDPESPR